MLKEDISICVNKSANFVSAFIITSDINKNCFYFLIEDVFQIFLLVVTLRHKVH